ncbi:MAG: glycosyltransferase family 4 protein [Nitrospira sp.]|nr:MAG: glycosyltransferase family 4 protein [Nitrospira sp.]
MKRVVLVISSLSPGGAERVLALMANYWAAAGWAVTVYTLDDGTQPPFFDLDVAVQHRPLGIQGDSANIIVALWNNLRRIAVLRKAVLQSRPDTVISFGEKTNVVTVLATLGLGFKVIVSERTDPHAHKIGRLWDGLRWWAYARADLIVVQSQAALCYFLPEFRRNAMVIPNPVAMPSALYSERETGSSPSSIIAVGRLSQEKGFDLLLRTFARLTTLHPEWTLTIVGEGPLRSKLEALRDSLNLAGRVSMPGLVKNVYEYLARASLFVMTSEFEGFPNALCEAMACGLPVVCVDCPGGIREIIKPGENGVLVQRGDLDALAEAMHRLMSNATERQLLGRRAMDVSSAFSVEKVMRMWEKVVQ